jgi:hypothetical protein
MTRLYACEGFAIRENDGLAVVNLLRSELPLPFLMPWPFVRPFLTVPPGLEVIGIERNPKVRWCAAIPQIGGLLSRMLFSLVLNRVRYFSIKSPREHSKKVLKTDKN